MLRCKITPPSVLAMADAIMFECHRPALFYCQRNAWAYKQWLDERNALADSIMRGEPA